MAYFGPVSEDEAEEPVLVDPRIKGMGPGLMELTDTDVGFGPGHTPMQDLDNMVYLGPNDEDATAEGPLLTVDQWKEAMAGALGKENDSFDVTQSHKDPIVNYSTLGLIYRFNEVSQNEHILNPTRIPLPVLHMAHSQTYIPFSLLTTSSLNRIHNNNNIHFIQEPNGTMRQTLNPAQFSSEDDLSIHEWWQAY